MSCSLLTPWLCSFNCFSCGNVTCGISYIYSLGYLSYGDVIYGIAIVYLTALTIVGIVDGSTLPFIIFCALKSMLSCSLFTPNLEAHPSSTLFLLLKTLFGKFVVDFFLFSNAFSIPSLVLLTLVNGFYGLSF